MGLILPQTVKVKIGSINYKYYKEKGYEFKKCGDVIEVNVLDLPKGSHKMVKIVCDVCGKEAEVLYYRVIEYNKENKLIICGSNSCKNKKYEDTCMKKYGVKNTTQLQEVQNKMKDTNLKRRGCMYSLQSQAVREKIENTNLERYGSKSPLGSKEIRNKSEKTWQEKYGENIINPSQAEEVKEKIKQTNLERHGCEYPMQNEEIRNKGIQTLKGKYGEDIINISQVKEIQDKIKDTNLERYSCEHPMQNEEIKNKSKATNLEKYGVDNPFQSNEIQNKIKNTNLGRYGAENPFGSKEIQDKIKQTMLNNYGVEHALQNRELLNKALDSFQFNSTGPCSRAQKYIHFLIGGVLNKRVCNSLVDICFEEEKIAIEYDGSGHFLGELIVNKDRSISKEAILREKNREDSIVNKGYKVIRFIATKDRIPSDEVILNLVEGFKNSDFKVIRINFEEGTIDRDYKEKWYCNFGKLRRITKEDLEQFESKKTINLK